MRKTTKNHGLLGAVVIAAVVVLFMVFSVGAMLGDYFGSGGGGFETGVVILCALLCLAVAGGVVAALVQRWREVRKGEEDEAKKY